MRRSLKSIRSVSYTHLDVYKRQDIVYILRGYEDFDGKLRGLGAEIERVNNAKDIRKFRLRA